MRYVLEAEWWPTPEWQMWSLSLPSLSVPLSPLPLSQLWCPKITVLIADLPTVDRLIGRQDKASDRKRTVCPTLICDHNQSATDSAQQRDPRVVRSGHSDPRTENRWHNLLPLLGADHTQTPPGSVSDQEEDQKVQSDLREGQKQLSQSVYVWKLQLLQFNVRKADWLLHPELR